MKTLGIRSHDFGRMTVEEMKDKHLAHGLNSMHLALHKAFSNIEDLYQNIDGSELLDIKNKLTNANIEIAVLGAYLNFTGPDELLAIKNTMIFKKQVRYAKLLGAKTIGTETGSVMNEYGYHKDNHSEKAYLMFCKKLEELLTEAESKDVVIAIEGVSDHIIHSNEKMKRLHKDMQSKNLKFIFDHVNMLNMDNYKNQNAVLDQALDLYGEHIAVLHVKDFVANDKIIEVAHGTGQYDFKKLSHVIKDLDVDVIIENGNIDNINRIKELITLGR